MTLIAKTSNNGRNHAIIKRGKGYAVIWQDAYTWKYVAGGKGPLSLEAAKELLTLRSL